MITVTTIYKVKTPDGTVYQTTDAETAGTESRRGGYVTAVVTDA
jgi:hypothetical protein